MAVGKGAVMTRNHLIAWAFSGLIGLSGVQAAHACAFHGYTPSMTFVDLLLDTEQVVEARLSPNDPTGFVPVETLLGPEVVEIPIAASALVSSALQDRPERTVLLARDGAYGPWREITILDSHFRDLVDVVIARQSHWQLGADTDRVQVFAGLVNNANPNMRRLALQELDRAPYHVLKKTNLPDVRNLTHDPEVADQSLRPIRILLAGLTGDQRYVPLVADGLAQAVNRDIGYTGAYATALIELSGTEGVAIIRDTYLRQSNLPDVTRDRLLQALAIQYRSADADVRRFITQEVAELSRSIPGFREAAALQFGF